MTRRTKRLSLIGAIALICLTSGALVVHARQATAEVKVDCLIFNGAGTGQTSCPGGVVIQSTGNQVFTIGIIGSGGIQTTCTHVFSSISPTFATLQGLGPFHVQTPQFNDTTSASDSSKSFGSGATVTYTATTLKDTTKTFPASFVGTTVEAVDTTTNPITPYTGTVASVSTNTITLTATGWTTPSLSTQPVNGDQYQVAPCTDTLGGHTMTVTTNGWVETTIDAATDEGSTEGAAQSPPDTVNIGVPVNGAEVFEDVAQCDIKVNPVGPGKFQVNAATNDSTTVTVNGTAGGTDNASNIPLTVTGTATCPTSATKAFYDGGLKYTDPLNNPLVVTDG